MTAADVEAATLRELARSAVQHLRAAALSITATADALDVMLNSRTAEPDPWQPVPGVETIGQPERVEVTAPDGSTVLPVAVAAEVLPTAVAPDLMAKLQQSVGAGCAACGAAEYVHAERGGHKYVRPVEHTVPLPPPATGPVQALPYPCRRGAPECTEAFDSPQALGAHHRHAHPKDVGAAYLREQDNQAAEPQPPAEKLAYREAPSDALVGVPHVGGLVPPDALTRPAPTASVMTVCAECSHSARMHDDDGCRYGRASLDGACSCLTPPGQIG